MEQDREARGPERDAVVDNKIKEAGAWVALRQPGPAVSACVPIADSRYPIQPVCPAARYSVRNVVVIWQEPNGTDASVKSMWQL
ncbi:MAG: hypothetical protein JW860_03685 [Sedimentisphaerales bacterium]|nr:hypothetical protein [Sedimentisphaerales bacterium]